MTVAVAQWCWIGISVQGHPSSNVTIFTTCGVFTNKKSIVYPIEYP